MFLAGEAVTLDDLSVMPLAPDLPSATRGSKWLQRDSLTSGLADSSFNYGSASFQQFFGDLDGDGTDTIGVRAASSNAWLLRNTNSTGSVDLAFNFALRSDRPLVRSVP